jgi:MFS transporter, DHA2 family, multidrug resistance protein
MDPIRKEEMGNATSMFNLMRNIGGSVGIAAGTTFLFRRQQFHIHQLGANVTAFNPQVRTWVAGIQSNMMAHGSDPNTAMHQSYGAIWGMVQRQASMLAFLDTFRTLAIVFLLVLPLLFLMKRPKHHRGGGAMH